MDTVCGLGICWLCILGVVCQRGVVVKIVAFGMAAGVEFLLSLPRP